MGKIRIATLGDETKEKAKKEKARIKREQKKIRKGVEVKEEEVPRARLPARQVPRVPQVPRETQEIQEAEATKAKKEEKKVAAKEVSPKSKKQKKLRSRRYQELFSLVDRSKFYEMKEALDLVKKTAKNRFVATVEAHFNLNKKISLKNSDNLKIERKAPLAHAKLGKVNEEAHELEQKLVALIKTIGATNISKLTLSSSMGPGIKVKV